MERSWIFVSIVLAALAVSGCSSVECGAGTVEQDGECVAKDDGENNAANGMPNGQTNGETNGTPNGMTNNSGGVTCGPGTEEDDQGRCVVSEPTTCGDGTELDANSGECIVTDAVCGTNTAFDGDSGTCLPTEMVCAAGTTFDAAMGLCMPDAECQPGDVVVDGICLSPVEELVATADVTETENNDPEEGGTAEDVTLPGVGEQTVVSGAIGDPTDLDGDGEPEQDIDVLKFTATAGQWITVGVQPVAGPPLSFKVMGPDGYERFNLPNSDYGAAREFVTSTDGDYRVVIAPFNHPTVNAGPPGPGGSGFELVGSADYSWAATIEVNDPPQATSADLEMGAEGDLTALRSNLLTDTFMADHVVDVDVDLDGFGAFELIYFDGTSVTGSAIGRFGGGGGNTIVPQSGNVTIAIDWIEAEPTTTYTLTAEDVGAIDDLGTVASGASVNGTVASLDGVQFFAFDLPAGHVAEFTQTNDDDNAIVLEVFQKGDRVSSGSLASTGAAFGDQFAYAIGDFAGGQFLVRVETNAPTNNLDLMVTAVEPTDLGMLDTNDTVNETSAMLVPDNKSIFFTATIASEVLLNGTLDASAGDVDFAMYDSTGEPFRTAGTFGGEEFDWLTPPGTYLLEVRAFNELTDGYTLDFVLNPFNAVDEMEPNDDSANATPGLTLMDQTRGTIDDDDEDWFSFTVTTAGVFTASASSLGTEGLVGVEVAFVNSNDEQIAQALGFGSQEVTSFLEPGSYFVSLTADNADERDYLLTLSSDPSGADVDDAGSNDSSANAQMAAPAADYTIAGVISGSADQDWYVFDLAAAETFSVAATGGQTLTFYDSAMQAIPLAGGFVDLPMGTSYMSVMDFVDGGPNGYMISFGVALDNTVTSAPGIAIPDGGHPDMVATDTIDIADACTLSDIQVPIDITHTWRGDLEVSLESPAGTTVQLWTSTGGSADDLIGTFPTTLTPAESLDGFLGEDAAGTWTLTVGDTFNADDGTLNSWGVSYNCQ